jgi:hypothetical protein
MFKKFLLRPKSVCCILLLILKYPSVPGRPIALYPHRPDDFWQSVWGIRDLEAELVILQQNISRSRIHIVPALVKFVCTWIMQGPGEQDSERRALESPSNWSKVSDSTYVLGLDEIERNKNEMSPSNDRNNVGNQIRVSVESSPLRSPMDSMFGDEHRQLLGGNHSASPIIMGPTWGGRTGNFSSKSSSSTRRYSFQYSKFVARRRVLQNT